MDTMNDSFGGGGFNANTTNAGGEGSDTKKDGVLPVVIKQLMLTDDVVTMFGFNYSMVNTVAIVRDINYSSTKVTYRLEDHTGQIDAHFWLDSEDTSKVPKVTKNAYARIIGGVRNTNDGKVVIVYHASEITSINDVTTHLLEVLYARYKAEALKGGTAAPTIAFGGASVGTMETDAPSENQYGLTGKNLLVYQAIKAYSSTSEEGIGRDQLEQKFPKIPKDEMGQIVDYMSSEGMIYTTIDSDHFLPCDFA